MPDDIPKRLDDIESDVRQLNRAVFGDEQHQVVGLVSLRSDTQRVIAGFDQAIRVGKWLTASVVTLGLGAIGAIIAS